MAARSASLLPAHALHPVDADNNALAALAQRAARAKVVLIGEASHGTRDFYAMRAALTERLIAAQASEGVGAVKDQPLHAVGVARRIFDPDCAAPARG